MYFDNDWVMLFPVLPTGRLATQLFARLTATNILRCLMNTSFYLTGQPFKHVHWTDTEMFVLCWINCINIGRCFFIQLNSSLHLHNLLFWSTFSEVSLWSKHNALGYSANLLLNFHYITHWFYHFHCKWNCGKAFSASAVIKFPFFVEVNLLFLPATISLMLLLVH